MYRLRQLFRKYRPWIPAPMSLLARRVWHHYYLPRKYSESDDPLLLDRLGYDVVPPARLRHRVHGSPDVSSFLEHVEGHYASLQPLHGRILDFGCGCGRTALAVRKHDAGIDYVGVDIDAECIEWASQTLRWGTFLRSSSWPPLPFPDEHFDRIISISVFTHLPEPLQDAWLIELRRISRPGARLTLSIHSGASNAKLPRRQRLQLDSEGHLFLTSGLGSSSEYGDAYHSWPYIERHWSRWFEVEGKIPLDSIQDLVVLRRPREDSPISDRDRAGRTTRRAET